MVVKMKFYIILTFGLLASSDAFNLERNSLSESRIINGRKALPGELPYQVSLQTNTKPSSFFCGGSILNENYVITAAHCVVGKNAGSIKIVAGTINLLKPKDTYFVEKIITHEAYNANNSWINDIALVKVKTPFVMNNETKNVILPKSDMVINDNDVAVVSGFGRKWLGGPPSLELLLVDIFIANQSLCSERYGMSGLNIYDSQVCAYDTLIKKGACHGDSGGPLTINGVLVGLVSWSYGCAQTDYPSVYTRVPKYLNWIEKNAV
ncbi:chymotrypsin-2-like [Leptopilina heterotoma]|uniref:chymotrypsin-2-like n=1 Tax=Leptopilina heterotoma TaxID=63436 RepID=UPI001CAA2CDC|nr:chymotrypsin-2-like [Leptopilina heterotoma]